jgi:hypothetical protein
MSAICPTTYITNVLTITPTMLRILFVTLPNDLIRLKASSIHVLVQSRQEATTNCALDTPYTHTHTLTHTHTHTHTLLYHNQ